ncbi:threonylcarbamoyl-AMP synthase [Halobacillus andaensis]|uniref:Threonylcarbamoyl-AMP synthase n=1 Tax=Halobacillus andaensis TaxID=1176239 RepID=A0A917B4Q4_HALAA|nr:L-threonylcarbamoyladenylate synthase [Halobacillus andaensis]MBP2004415.1 L-threonylcarbamoyladenylate synthase [Halobacillus andaensis]GGF21807.1 threonylcarbamoyl-AMP synthase [Halobacillus andaensis]
MTLQTKRWQRTTKINEQYHVIEEAAALLKDQQVVAFPTETVYGLGADATSEAAVQRIFEAKGRPSDNPLIVHVGDRSQVEQLVTHIPEIADKLMDQFWPGPLTLVLPSNHKAARNVTAGLDTVAIRMPSDPIALALLKETGLPLAAPSANRSGRPSPTDAAHVQQDLDGRIAGIVDGGPTGVGVESTVLDCTTEVPIILRPGGVTKEDLESFIPNVVIDPALADQAEDQPKSPGMKYTHYAPEAPLWLVEGDDEFFQHQLESMKAEGQRVAVIASRELVGQLNHEYVTPCGSRQQLTEVAGELYRALRYYKKADVDVILCESFPEHGVGAAIMNRLHKAATQKITQY